MTPFEQKNEVNRFAYRYEIGRSWLAEHRSIVVLLAIWIVMAAFEAVFVSAMRNTEWAKEAAHLATPGISTPIDFGPEVWLATVAMVLGTLIIVISIASQSTPKLIDLYMRDWLSLAYLWFMLLAMLQNILLQNNLTGTWEAKLEAFLNAYIYLPLALILAIPYIFYMLSNTKTSKVV
jgi:hypothetical protein